MITNLLVLVLCASVAHAATDNEHDLGATMSQLQTLIDQHIHKRISDGKLTNLIGDALKLDERMSNAVSEAAMAEGMRWKKEHDKLANVLKESESRLQLLIDEKMNGAETSSAPGGASSMSSNMLQKVEDAKKLISGVENLLGGRIGQLEAAHKNLNVQLSEIGTTLHQTTQQQQKQTDAESTLNSVLAQLKLIQKQQQTVQTEIAKISKQQNDIVAEQLRMKKELEAAMDSSSSGFASWQLWMQERMNVAARNIGSAAAYLQAHASGSRDKWGAFYDANLSGPLDSVCKYSQAAWQQAQPSVEMVTEKIVGWTHRVRDRWMPSLHAFIASLRTSLSQSDLTKDLGIERFLTIESVTAFSVLLIAVFMRLVCNMLCSSRKQKKKKKKNGYTLKNI